MQEVRYSVYTALSFQILLNIENVKKIVAGSMQPVEIII